MEQTISSEGKCVYCNTTFSQKDIVKHLAVHLAQMEKESAGKKNKTFCHIEVSEGLMFLHLLVNGSAKMSAIDYFLREIWLECCGHMSGFKNKNFEISKNDLVANIFSPKVKVFYDYDYGDTTSLVLKAHKQYQLSLKYDIVLLSRNEPLKILCSVCKKKPAISLCTTCFYDKEAFYCKSCAAKHEETCEDFADYANMPVVNSPRMGVCGYTGGSIDVERDGHYKK